MGCPGQTGQVSRALSQTVITKSKAILRSSSQDLLRASEASIAKRSCRTFSVTGFTTPLGCAPALYASKRSPPRRFKKYSAKTLRAEFPVQRNRTRNGRSCVGLIGTAPGLDVEPRQPERPPAPIVDLSLIHI